MRIARARPPMSVPVASVNQLPAKFVHKDADIEFRLQCFLTVRDEEGRTALLRIEGYEGWCIPAESMLVNESPDQAAVRVARTWFESPLGVWLERVLSFPATGGDDNRWYVVFVYAADKPADLKTTPDTQEIRFVAQGEAPGPFAMAHADVWNALK